MHEVKPFTIKALLGANKLLIGFTWALVLLENALIVLIPLFIGYAIDGLLQGDFHDFYVLSAILVLIVALVVARRIYDTRAFGTIRVNLGLSVAEKLAHLPISTRNARLDMSRELVDFLENDIPPLMTAIIQLVAAFVILTSAHVDLGLSAIVAGVLIIAVYSAAHSQFVTTNAALNNCKEQQVDVLEQGVSRSIHAYLQKINLKEIKLSDTEAIVFGLIFLLLFIFVLFNLWLATHSLTLTPGSIFTIVSYSLEFLDAAILLPITLQTWSRLSEIIQRLNTPAPIKVNGEIQ
ncbi:ABC transporter six-transmembrane domain-containing protein [Motilimonas sp. 1_MG-2023]|uniref:ABC transporter six-transmembrane domain-containing protein n=1 Tax=Motilimonas sp. 1_MG-2023 TaxID=3062672 RepID=UPI0026E3CD2A|nr:ABC transporter six-transmembrane domain-containing protein [Motilimonas sp. 1_MG-2023]MDO6527407.1 ABC transporter six-transmembrane domain-containing protein [Motilimonas sp. 1_MG-2023]